MKQLRGTALKRFLRQWRKENLSRREVILILQSVSYPANVGSLFRIADAAGVRHLYLCSATPVPPHPKIAKVARSKENSVRWSYHQNVEDAIERVRADGFTIVALEITDSARPYFTAEFPARVCLILGNEEHGVSNGILSLCDYSIFVPMYGRGRSLNVHVSAAVVLFHILQESEGASPLAR